MLNQNHFLQRSREYSYQSRIDIINTIYKAKGGHVGGSLSLIDILSSLYSLKSEYDFEFILSKGHCLLAWLVTLIRVKELDESILADFYTISQDLEGILSKAVHLQLHGLQVH